MPRKARFNLLGVPQHVIQRGNNRESCFFSETDYIRYLQDLQTAADKHQCHIHAYVLMTNHVHLLVTPFIDCGVSLMMKGLWIRAMVITERILKQNWLNTNLNSFSA